MDPKTFSFQIEIFYEPKGFIKPKTIGYQIKYSINQNILWNKIFHEAKNFQLSNKNPM